MSIRNVTIEQAMRIIAMYPEETISTPLFFVGEMLMDADKFRY